MKTDEPPKAEEPREEIYQGIQWLEVDPTDIEKFVIEKVNAYRIAQGDTVATMLSELTEVARYRANKLTTNFEHRGNSMSARNLNMVNMLTAHQMICQLRVITKDIAVKLSVWEIGLARRKVCQTTS